MPYYMADLVDVVDKAKAIVSEHSLSYIIIAKDESGDITYAQSDPVSSLGLMELSREYIKNEIIGVDIEMPFDDEDFED